MADDCWLCWLWRRIAAAAPAQHAPQLEQGSECPTTGSTRPRRSGEAAAVLPATSHVRTPDAWCSDNAPMPMST